MLAQALRKPRVQLLVYCLFHHYWLFDYASHTLVCGHALSLYMKHYHQFQTSDFKNFLYNILVSRLTALSLGSHVSSLKCSMHWVVYSLRSFFFNCTTFVQKVDLHYTAID